MRAANLRFAAIVCGAVGWTPCVGRRSDVSGRGHGGIRQRPRPGTARRFAPDFRSAAGAARRPRSRRVGGRGTRLPTAPGSGIGTSSCAGGALRQVPIGNSLFVKGGGAPLSHFPPVTRAPNLRFAAISFFRLLGAPPPLLRQPEYGRGNAGLQTGTARRGRAKRVHLSIPQGALQRERLQETPTLTSLGEPQPTKPGEGSRRPGNVHPLRRHPTGAPQASDI